ncbi:MAG: hypothetical protein EBZ78_07600 [Verrucomicrobia bacterium]|nr:hypothetical protein [Verrucomicrobiota bacterium]
MDVLSCFLDLKRVALDKFGDQLRKRKAAIFGHFDASFFYLHRDVEVGRLALITGCHMYDARCAPSLWRQQKSYFLKKYF